ncbi:hypothetical protein K458DRAFT_50684 [Lentithecium fluviatile CBS 122367]|uniref:Uncharacterized protein n=1 Tax=Lentithecium fluviatile CBS 122367 TaxID=1168545 RepID=A0A6G1IXW6_9PLEO|nr:hypothetical protein K458DRAFT_50684 [Lentithecium fluviatile CBS 122367]
MWSCGERFLAVKIHCFSLSFYGSVAIEHHQFTNTFSFRLSRIRFEAVFFGSLCMTGGLCALQATGKGEHFNRNPSS